METLKLATKERAETGRQAKKVRAAGSVPAVIYGRGEESRNVQVAYVDFDKVYRQAGESALIDLDLGNEQVKVLVKDVQRHPLTDRYTHVDFHKVNLKEKITTEIPLEFVGESAAVKTLGGSLVKSRDYVEIECLPTDLVHEIKVDLSRLATFDDVIRVSDLEIPPGIEILDDADMTIAVVEPPLTEEQLAAMEAADAAPVDVSAIKTEAEEKKEKEAAAKAAEAETEAKK